MNFDLAPPSRLVDGLQAVPIDIQRVTASFVFDGLTSSGTADATMEFTLGAEAGNPIFDLRQTPTAAWLDGAPIPIARLAHHDFGGGSGAELRILESVLAASSSHTLRVTYSLATPIGGTLPAMTWSAGPRLVFRFAMSDLSPAQYLEQWLPANLIFDQLELTLEITLTGTSIAHTAVTNGAVTTLAPNHLRIAFPATFTALSHLLELRPTDALVHATGTVTLPVSGTTVTIDAYKPSTSSVSLAAQIGVIQSALATDEVSAGRYVHGSRFVAFFGGGGMEYDGGTTTGTGALRHETFHSFWGRGVKPAAQPDGWWDEAYAVYNDQGATGALPFDYGDPPVELSTRNAWSRITPTTAYSDGVTFFAGVASKVGVATFTSLMRELHDASTARPMTTETLESFLLARSGAADLVDAFHRFVYGFSDPSPAPEIWLRDEVGHTGADAWGGRFWDSPDLWVRRADDGGTDHQNPMAGQDNWLHARVRNLATGGPARHFAVVFNVKSYAGTEFLYPADFLPGVAAVVGFELAPGQSRVVKARWPAALVPSAGTHACLLASAIARSDHPSSGTHVFEHANLAQKNLTIADLPSGNWLAIPFVFANTGDARRRFSLELRRRKGEIEIGAALLVRSPSESLRRPEPLEREAHALECGAKLAERFDPRALWTSRGKATFAASRFSGAVALELSGVRRGGVEVTLGPREQRRMALRLTAPKDACEGQEALVDLVKRDAKTRRILGGIAARIRITRGRGTHTDIESPGGAEKDSE